MKLEQPLAHDVVFQGRLYSAGTREVPDGFNDFRKTPHQTSPEVQVAMSPADAEAFAAFKADREAKAALAAQQGAEVTTDGQPAPIVGDMTPPPATGPQDATTGMSAADANTVTKQGKNK